MARILSISYDETLLRTRHLLLGSVGHKVTSALGFHDAMQGYANPADLLIMGHSIPKNDKVDIIECFREKNPKALVIALTRAGEARLKEVDTYLNPGDPEELLRAIQFALQGTGERRRNNVRAIR